MDYKKGESKPGIWERVYLPEEAKGILRLASAVAIQNTLNNSNVSRRAQRIFQTGMDMLDLYIELDEGLRNDPTIQEILEFEISERPSEPVRVTMREIIDTTTKVHPKDRPSLINRGVSLPHACVKRAIENAMSGLE